MRDGPRSAIQFILAAVSVVKKDTKKEEESVQELEESNNACPVRKVQSNT